jgi:hypothetical protein
MQRRKKMKRIPLYTALALGLATGIAEADTITETYTFAPFVGYTSETGTSFRQFNPAQGTLNSITFTDVVIAMFAGGGANEFNQAQYIISLNGVPFVMSASRVGDGSAGASPNNFTESKQDIAAAFVGSGNVATSLEVFNFNGTSAMINSFPGIESVTYNFTPTLPVPEPGSLGLLGTGLLGLGLVGFASRRHFFG